MSGTPWRISERILLAAVLVLAALVVVRLTTRTGPSAPVAVRETGPPPADGPAQLRRPRQAAGAPPSAACAEVLARIRSCSPADLEAVVDGMGGLEAYRLYRTLTVTDRQTVLSALPPPLLARKAQEHLGLPNACFRHLDEPGLLASSLIDAAMGTAAPADPQRRVLGFATAVDGQGVPRDLRGTFAARDRRIYACLDGGAEPAGEPGVLVRWSEVDSGNLVHLRYEPLSVNRRWNHVYFEVAGTWRTGSYRVAFYRVAATATLLAEGTYVVADE